MIYKLYNTTIDTKGFGPVGPTSPVKTGAKSFCIEIVCIEIKTLNYHPTGLIGTNVTTQSSHLDLVSAVIDGAIMATQDGMYNLYLKCSDSAKLLIFGQYAYLSLKSENSEEVMTFERIPLRVGVPLEIQIQFVENVQDF